MNCVNTLASQRRAVLAAEILECDAIPGKDDPGMATGGTGDILTGMDPLHCCYDLLLVKDKNAVARQPVWESACAGDGVRLTVLG